MHKCPNCGQEFESKFCPNCGAQWQEEKTCPKCGAKISGSSRFCTECGYSFTGTKNATASKEKKSSQIKQKLCAMVAWAKSHLKIVVPVALGLVVLIILLSLIPTFIAMKTNGTYYQYRGGKFDEETYFTLSGGKWTDEDGEKGTYKIDGENIVFYVELFGTTEELASGTVSNGVLSLETGGASKDIYVKKDHKHEYSEWKTVREADCTTDGLKTRTCACGDTERDETPRLGHTGEWTVTKEATCTEEGSRKAHCTRCDKNVTEVIEKIPHNYSTFGYDYSNHWKCCKACGDKTDAEKHTTGNTCATCGIPLIATDGLQMTLNSDKNGYTVTGIGSVTKKIIRVPQTFEGLPVTAISGYVFQNNSSLTGIIISDSVTSIGNGAFDGCSSLASINIPDSITSIGSGTFRNCSSLTSIKIPDSVSSIGNEAFYGCSKLTSITIPDSVTSISERAFYNCSIKTATIPAMACSYIKSSALKTVLITSGDNIGSKAFGGCSSLTSVNISDSVTSINIDAFSGCSSLSRIIVSENNPNYSSQDGILYNKATTEFICIPKAISGAISIPDGITSIGSEAFRNCTSITSINMPDSLTSIGDDAFRGCSSIASITIPNNVTSIGSGAFSNCTFLDNIIISDSISSIYNFTFFGCSSLKNITIPNSVTYIDGSAFSECSSLTNINIPDSVTTIDTSMGILFSGCSSLKSITISENNPNYSSQNGILYNKAKTEIVYVPKAISGAVSIPDSVTSIGEMAFSGCSKLTSVTIPDSVTSIGFRAFGECSSLTSINIPNGVTSIAPEAFYGCSKLTSISIPDGVTYLGSMAFHGCTKIIQTENGVQYVGKWAIECDTNVTQVTLRSDTKGLSNLAFYDCSKLTSITIPDSVTSIGNEAFRGCSLLTSINFDGTIEQWTAISKGDRWNSETGKYTVHCTDGTVAKDGTVTKN